MKNTIFFILCLLGLVFSGLIPILGQELKFSPEPGARIYVSRPEIRIAFAENFSRPGLQIYLNQSEISGRCLKLGNDLVFQPSTPLPQGKNTLEVKTVKGELLGKSEFQILPAHLIESVSYLGNGVYYEGDDFKVILKGKTGGKAYFNLGEEVTGVPLPETKPGLYEGTYIVQLGDYQSHASLTGFLSLPNGEEDSLTSGEPVDVFGQYFKIELLTPKDGSDVGTYFDIKGKTQPDSDIRIYPQLSYPGLSAGDDKIQKTNVITAKSDENGYFKISYGLPIKIHGLKLKFNLLAINPQGLKSMPCRLEVTVK